MVPSTYDAFLAAVATAGAALIGPAVRSCLGPRRHDLRTEGHTWWRSAGEHRLHRPGELVRVPVLGLIPKVNIGEPALIMALICITATVRLDRRLHTSRNLIVLALTLLAYAAQLGSGCCYYSSRTTAIS